MISTTGRLLVASPLMGDPHFERSVILMIQHNEDGAFGVVLNNQSDTSVEKMLPSWSKLASAPASLFLGGPVAPESLIGLARVVEKTNKRFQPLVENVGPIDLDQEQGELYQNVKAIRLFAGYSGWGPKQLETELTLGAWFVLDADPGDAFITEPDQLWSFVLRRQHGPIAWLANYPTNPKLN